MLVNNINISNFKAELMKKDIQTSEIIIYDDWLRKANNPTYLGKQEQFKQIKVQFIVQDDSDESALNDISNLIKQLEKCTIKLDDLSFYYDCTISGKSHQRISVGSYALDVDLKSGYSYKPEVIELANRIATKTINVSGNVEAPAVVEIVPSINIIDLTISGFRDIFTIQNLKAGQKVIVNGEACTVTENGINKFSEFDAWEFPKLSPGANTISFSKSNCDISIKYKPRWI